MTTPRHLLGLASLGIGLVSGLGGGIGTWVAVAATSRNLGLGDGGELALVAAPALLALLGGALAMLVAAVPLAFAGSPASARVLGALGALVGAGVALLAGGWVAFVGGLWLLAAFAWH